MNCKNINRTGVTALMLALLFGASNGEIVAEQKKKRAANTGTFTASSECIGGIITFQLTNPSSLVSIRLHDRMFIVSDQSFQVVYQPVPGPLGYIPGIQFLPNNKRSWNWNQKTNSGMQVPVGTYGVVLAVQDDSWDPFVSPQPDPALYMATFKILPVGPAC